RAFSRGGGQSPAESCTPRQFKLGLRPLLSFDVPPSARGIGARPRLLRLGRAVDEDETELRAKPCRGIDHDSRRGRTTLENQERLGVARVDMTPTPTTNLATIGTRTANIFQEIHQFIGRPAPRTGHC